MVIQIKREKRMAYCARVFSVYFDEVFAGGIKNGASLSLDLPNKPGILSFKLGGKTKAVASISPDAKSYTIVCWGSENGGIEFYSDSPEVQKQMDASRKHGFGVFALVLAVLFVLFLIFRPKFIFFITPLP